MRQHQESIGFIVEYAVRMLAMAAWSVSNLHRQGSKPGDLLPHWIMRAPVNLHVERLLEEGRPFRSVPGTDHRDRPWNRSFDPL